MFISEPRSYKYCVECLAVVALTFGAVPVARAETEPAPAPQDSALVEAAAADSGAVADTIPFVPPSNPHIAGEVANPVDLEKHLTQNPTVALFKSLLVPGLGQIGNHRYFKAALFAGLEGWWVSKAVHYGHQAKDAQANYDAQTTDLGRFVAYTELDQKRKKRNKFIWFAGITTFVSMFDAYVDAQLSGSPTESRNDKFGFDVAPDDGGGVKAAISFSF